jgi:hypothetical protein
VTATYIEYAPYRDVPLTTWEARAVEFARRLPGVIAQLIHGRIDTRKYARWLADRSEFKRSAYAKYLAVLKRKHTEVVHWSTTAAGLRPCKGDCMFHRHPPGEEMAT